MSGFVLKLIAAVTMLIDHAGIMLFPDQPWMRVVGRIAYPLFAWCIAEGFRYTRNRLQYFLQIFLLGVGCQIIYTIAERDLYFGILLTFSFSLGLMALLRETKAALLGEETAFGDLLQKRGISAAARTGIVTAALFGFALLCAVVTMKIRVDYGFMGIFVPVLAYLPENKWLQRVFFAGGLLALSVVNWHLGDERQIWCLLALIPLVLYNGRPGKYRMKWFFYIFYPAHMALLYLLSMIF